MSRISIAEKLSECRSRLGELSSTLSSAGLRSDRTLREGTYTLSQDVPPPFRRPPPFSRPGSYIRHDQTNYSRVMRERLSARTPAQSHDTSISSAVSGTASGGRLHLSYSDPAVANGSRGTKSLSLPQRYAREQRVNAHALRDSRVSEPVRGNDLGSRRSLSSSNIPYSSVDHPPLAVRNSEEHWGSRIFCDGHPSITNQRKMRDTSCAESLANSVRQDVRSAWNVEPVTHERPMRSNFRLHSETRSEWDREASALQQRDDESLYTNFPPQTPVGEELPAPPPLEKVIYEARKRREELLEAQRMRAEQEMRLEAERLQREIEQLEEEERAVTYSKNNILSSDKIDSNNFTHPLPPISQEQRRLSTPAAFVKTTAPPPSLDKEGSEAPSERAFNSVGTVGVPGSRLRGQEASALYSAPVLGSCAVLVDRGVQACVNDLVVNTKSTGTDTLECISEAPSASRESCNSAKLQPEGVAKVLTSLTGAEVMAVMRLRGLIQSSGSTGEQHLPPTRCHKMRLTEEEHEMLLDLRKELEERNRQVHKSRISTIEREGHPLPQTIRRSSSLSHVPVKSDNKRHKK